jgi:hypothetical protein
MTIQRNWQHRVHKINKRYRILKGRSKNDNSEKLAISGTQDEDKQKKKHNTTCLGHHYVLTNTNNVV